MSRATEILREAWSGSYGSQGAHPNDFKVGQRVQAHPGTDTWMRGDRFGDVVKVGRSHVHVKMDRSGRTIRFHPANLLDSPMPRS